MTALWIVLGAYVLLLLGVARISVRPPRTPLFLSPGMLGAPQEEVAFRSVDGADLVGWWVEAQNSRGVVILAHGYAMNRAELAAVAYDLWKDGVSTFLFDFRSHGRSVGRVSTLGFLEQRDVAAAVGEATRRAPGKPVVLFGSSMGAAACAFALAAEPALAVGLIVDGSYSKLASATLGWWRFLGGKALMVALSPTVLFGWAMNGVNPFSVDVAVALGKLGGKPALLIHGDRDDLVLPSAARRNFDAHPGPKAIEWMAGCGHCEGRWIHPEAYRAAIRKFLASNDVFGPP